MANPFSGQSILGGNPYGSKEPRLNIFEDKAKPPNKQWCWNIWMSSDIVAASSEGYKNRSEAIENLKKVEQHIKWLRENNKIV